LASVYTNQHIMKEQPRSTTTRKSGLP
jgi:hypothetical protein